MRGRCSKKGKNKAGLEIKKLDKLTEEPGLSGAYIRSLVKQLTSSRAKRPLEFYSPNDLPGKKKLALTKRKMLKIMGVYPFDEVMEFPAWLMQMKAVFSNALMITTLRFLPKSCLGPCMGIDEIEGKDVEWIARED
nr:myb-like protein P [Ipomoea batatas]